jgi:hypothetical protein
MTPAVYLERARAEVVGQEVSHRRLAVNSFLAYVDCEPGDPPSAGATSLRNPTVTVSTERLNP